MQTLLPTAVALTGLFGSVTDLDESPDSPDANWCIRSGAVEAIAYPSAGALTLAGQTVTAVANAEAPLFFDDFASGDIAKYNALFNWNKESFSSTPGAGTQSDKIFAVTGPSSYGTVNAYEFDFGTWQELGFTLRNGEHPVLWLSYWMYVPSNYVHGSVSGAANNKGWFTTWKSGTYSSGTFEYAFDFYPSPDDATDSMHRCWGCVNRDTPDYIRSGFSIPGGDGYAYALRPTTDYGRWVHIIGGFKAQTSNGAGDGRVWYYVDDVETQRWEDVDAYIGKSGYDGVDTGYILGYWNTTAPAEHIKMYMTHFRYGTSLAQVRDTAVFGA